MREIKFGHSRHERFEQVGGKQFGSPWQVLNGRRDVSFFLHVWFVRQWFIFSLKGLNVATFESHRRTHVPNGVVYNNFKNNLWFLIFMRGKVFLFVLTETVVNKLRRNCSDAENVISSDTFSYEKRYSRLDSCVASLTTKFANWFHFTCKKFENVWLTIKNDFTFPQKVFSRVIIIRC